MRGLLKPAMLGLLLSAILTSTACVSIPTSATEATADPLAVCKEWRAITYSRNDTPETQRQIVGNNAARGGWGCP